MALIPAAMISSVMAARSFMFITRVDAAFEVETLAILAGGELKSGLRSMSDVDDIGDMDWVADRFIYTLSLLRSLRSNVP
jgi:hypothetical protein